MSPAAAARALGGGIALLLALALLVALPFRPAPAQAAPVVCKAGINVEDLYDLDMARDTFGAILWVWTLCPPADLTPLANVAFPTASSLNLGPVDTEDLASGERYASRRVQGTFRYDWEMDDYPFDRQRVTIPMDETWYGAERLVFEPDTAGSFLSPGVRERLEDWATSDLEVSASVLEEPSSYGVPGDEAGSRYARVEAAVTLVRADLVTFVKLTLGIFVGVFIAFMSFFYDPNDRSGFGGKLGLLVGVLFAVLLSLRNADSSIGDTGRMTLITRIHLLTLGFIVILAVVALRDRRRVERGLPVRHPDWPMLALVGSLYLATVGGLIAAAW